MYCVYIHQRLHTGVVFYVGRGRLRRARINRVRNPYWGNIVKKDGGFDVTIAAQNLSLETSAQLEILLIQFYGKENLTNMSDGGEYGAVGVKHGEIPAERGRKISAAKMGHTVPDEARKKLRIANLGKVMPEEVKKKLSSTQKERLRDRPDLRDRVSKFHKGKIVSDETRAKLKAKRALQVFSEADRLKMSIAAKNRCKKIA